MTKVKICGITNLADAQAAVEAGADLLGFIFYEPSPRYVSPETVQEIVAELKQAATNQAPATGAEAAVIAQRTSHPIFVGVFVNESLEQVQHTLEFCGLDAAQLHGDEPPALLAALPGRAYKALRPKSKETGQALIEKYLPCSPAPLLPCLLLDAYHPTLYGGTGRVTDWSFAAQVARNHRLLLAGSLTPANVAAAVAQVQPWGVDVSSGVEAEKGRKDWEKVRAFVRNVRRET